MITKLMNLLLGCSHSNHSFPITMKSENVAEDMAASSHNKITSVIEVYPNVTTRPAVSEEWRANCVMKYMRLSTGETCEDSAISRCQEVSGECNLYSPLQQSACGKELQRENRAELRRRA